MIIIHVVGKPRSLRSIARIGGKPVILDGDGADGKRSDVTSWSSNVLRNSEIETLDLGKLPPGRHRLRLIYGIRE